mgnify:CR=1 FL=1
MKQSLKSLLLTLLALIVSFNVARAQKDQPYLKADDLPNILSFLPPPPSEDSHLFSADKAIHDWARALQPSERTRRAISDGTTDVDTMAMAFSGAFGIELSEKQISGRAITLNIDYEDVLYADSFNSVLLKEE